jgi:hypothetical protein
LLERANCLDLFSGERDEVSGRKTLRSSALERVVTAHDFGGPLTELKFSNSMIEAWWRSLKHQWLFLHSLDSVTTVRRLVAFYVDEHNRVLPHSAFRGQTPDEPPWQPTAPQQLHARKTPRPDSESGKTLHSPMFHPVRNICGSHPPDDRELRSLGYRVERLTIPASNPA